MRIDPPHEWRQVGDHGLPHQPRFRQPFDDRPLYAYTAPAWLLVILRPAMVRRQMGRVRLGQALDQLQGSGCDRTVLYCWHPRFLESVDLVAHDLLLYHIVDEYSYAAHDPPTS